MSSRDDASKQYLVPASGTKAVLQMGKLRLGEVRLLVKATGVSRGRTGI